MADTTDRPAPQPLVSGRRPPGRRDPHVRGCDPAGRTALPGPDQRAPRRQGRGGGRRRARAGPATAPRTQHRRTRRGIDRAVAQAQDEWLLVGTPDSERDLESRIREAAGTSRLRHGRLRPAHHAPRDGSPRPRPAGARLRAGSASEGLRLRPLRPTTLGRTQVVLVSGTNPGPGSGYWSVRPSPAIWWTGCWTRRRSTSERPRRGCSPSPSWEPLGGAPRKALCSKFRPLLRRLEPCDRHGSRHHPPHPGNARTPPARPATVRPHAGHGRRARHPGLVLRRWAVVRSGSGCRARTRAVRAGRGQRGRGRGVDPPRLRPGGPHLASLGAVRPPVEEELRGVLPVVRQLTAAGGTVSVDPVRAEVATRVLDAGARLVNDVWGLADPAMLPLMARAEPPSLRAMHSRGHAAGVQTNAVYDDVVTDVVGELRLRIEAASEAGIRPGRLIIDPGLGFATESGHNGELLGRLRGHRRAGPSRPRGRVTQVVPGQAAVVPGPAAGGPGDGTTPPGTGCGTPRPPAVSVPAAAQGAWCLRVHDVGLDARRGAGDSPLGRRGGGVGRVLGSFEAQPG